MPECAVFRAGMPNKKGAPDKDFYGDYRPNARPYAFGPAGHLRESWFLSRNYPRIKSGYLAEGWPRSICVCSGRVRKTPCLGKLSPHRGHVALGLECSKRKLRSESSRPKTTHASE